MTDRHWRAISFFVILLGIGLGLLPYLRMSVPDPMALRGAPAAQRAMQTIAFLSQAPRGAGTAQHAAARAFLQEELRALGMEVQSQAFQAAGQPAPLMNIAGRLAGQNPDQNAVVLIAHYDADPADCPGAADNASGVAVILEIARAVAGGPRPANDLIVLFTDGEELGVLGAPEFLRHPWAKTIKVALNFDSLSLGPVFLWQSSPQNGWLIERYGMTPSPMAGSWMDSIARSLPLDTDLRPFVEAGVTGASFTTPFLPVQSHTALDQFGMVSAPSIRHGLEQGLSLTRALLDSDVSQPAAPDRVYFNVWGSWFLSYPASLASGFGILAGVLTLGAVAWFIRRKGVSARAVASGALFSAANLLFAFLLQVLIEVLVMVKMPLLAPWVKIPASVILLSLLLGWGVRRLRKRISAEALLLGGQLVWALLALWTSLANPLFSPLFTWILLASLLPYALHALRLGQTAARTAHLGALLIGLVFGAPVVYLLYMITGLMLIPAALGAAAWALLLGLVQPAHELLVQDGQAAAAPAAQVS